ncbi:succinyl-CoA synthetase [Candidatus Saccharibacteria bacterium]|jgi:succinyl-CoA synthetase beta subunit|nr:succinyl-CoA synthetase [Candidatus Saccharibacteria bacterium]
MKLLEYEAKQLVSNYSIKIPNGKIIKDYSETETPVVLKSQVLSGRRNRFGGVKIVKDSQDLTGAFKTVKSTPIEGHLPFAILAEEVLSINKEFYISLLINREKSRIDLLISSRGGIDIESEGSDSFLQEPISTDNLKDLSLKVSEFLNIETHEFIIEDLLKNLLRCFIENDITLLEINPLVLTSEKELVAADCKITLDDNAIFRHASWNFYDKPANTNFVTLNDRAEIATVANGAGLAMATVDSIESAGLPVANFLDIGGGANEATVLAALSNISRYSNLKAIIVNIFAGITHCDEVARAIVSAKQQIPHLPPLFIRLEGNQLDQAKLILSKSSLKLYESLESAINDAKEVAGA